MQKGPQDLTFHTGWTRVPRAFTGPLDDKPRRGEPPGAHASGQSSYLIVIFSFFW
jgi:hypothetical protein